MLLYPVKFEFSLFWMSQCGNNNKLALQHGGFCTMRPLAAKGLLGLTEAGVCLIQVSLHLHLL